MMKKIREPLRLLEGTIENKDCDLNEEREELLSYILDISSCLDDIESNNNDLLDAAKIIEEIVY